MRVLIGCECSGRVREAFRALGHDAWSADLQPAEDGSPFHIIGDVRDVLDDGWDLSVMHPVCTRLANSGVRWLNEPPPGRTLDEMWDEFEVGVALYLACAEAPIPRKAIENPIMHRYARERIRPGKRHVVQPWWFGDPAFKATGFELHGLPPLQPTRKLTPPRPGTDEHKAWSVIHRAPPRADRARERSRTFPGIADAMAAQWGREDREPHQPIFFAEAA